MKKITKKNFKWLVTIIIYIVIMISAINSSIINYKKYHHERTLAILFYKEIDNTEYRKKLYISGDFEYTTTIIKAENIEVDKNSILTDMLYFNYYKEYLDDSFKGGPL